MVWPKQKVGISEFHFISVSILGTLFVKYSETLLVLIVLIRTQLRIWLDKQFFGFDSDSARLKSTLS